MIWQESVGPKSQTRTGRLRKLVLMPDIKIKAHFIELSHRTENLPQSGLVGLRITN
jgi:hypothetical protein